MTIFHLAIPSHDLKTSQEFYSNKLGAETGRSYPGYAIFNFYGHQVVAHLNPKEIDKKVSMYPRHFGIIFDTEEQFRSLYEKAKSYNLSFFEELFERFEGAPGWHMSFFLVDPSNNLIEFKYYKDPSFIFSK